MSIIFLLVVHPLFSQTNEYQLDSIKNSFREVSGNERIERIAYFIRNTTFSEVEHEHFLHYIKEIYEWEKKHPNAKLLNTIRLGHINLLLAEEGHKVEAVRKTQEILHSGEPISSKDSVSVYTFMFNTYIDIGSYSKAWEALKNRDEVLSNTKIKNSFFDSFKKRKINDLANIYLVTNKYNEAIEQYKKVIKIAKKENDFHYEAGAYNNLGLVYLKMHMPDSSMAYFNQSLVAWKKNLEGMSSILAKDSMFFNIVHGNIGQTYNKKGEYKKAIPFIRNNIETYKKNQDYIRVANGLNALSQSYLGLHQPKKALVLIDSVSNFIKKSKSVFNYGDMYQNKVKVYEYLGNTKKAYKYYKKLIEYNNSIDTIGNTNRTTILEVVYEVEHMNREITIQKSRILNAEAEVNRQQEYKQALAAGLVVISIILTLLALNIGQWKKRSSMLIEKNKEIEHQKEIIEKSLTEKETLLKEIHHRVKNNLQLISGMLELQGTKFKDKNIYKVMEEGQNRIKSMALIHQQLYESEEFGKIYFRKYVLQLTNDINIMANETNKNIDIVLDIIDFSLDINTAVPIGLIINELVVNSFKHGFSNKKEGTITITLKALEDEYYQLTICDNGKGLPANFDIKNANSLGLRLVEGLSRQIGGNCEFKNETGTTVIIKFRNDNN